MPLLPLPIVTRRLILRSFRLDDLETFHAYRDDPEVARYQGWSAPYDRAEAAAFVSSMAGRAPGVPGEWCQIALELRAGGRMIGDCAVRVVEEDSRQAEIGTTLSSIHQGKGFAVEAVANLVDRLFADLGLHRVRAVCDTQNAGSVRLLERLGFRREGHFVENIRFKGAWGSEYAYALLETEWKTLRDRWSAAEWI